MARKLKLLNIEDSESDSALIVRELHRAGYEVEVERVEDPEALQKALQDRSWDLVICDYRMPAIEAPAALRVVQSTGLDVPFLVISGTIGEDLAVAMMKAGAHDYLMKDNLTRLGAAVDRELCEVKVRAERRQAMKDLADREEQLSLAIEANDVGVFDHDPTTGMARYTETARKHLGAPAGGRPTIESFLESLHDEDRDRVKRAMVQAFLPESDGRYAAEYRLKTPVDGREKWISAWGRVLRDAEGRPVRFLGVLRDITERKQAERDLLFQTQLTACITEQSRDCVIMTDLEGRKRFVNSATERLFGYGLDDFQGKTVHDLLHHSYPDGRPYPREECPLTKAIGASGMVQDHEDVFFHKDGTPIDVSISSLPLTVGGAKVGIVNTIRDIRERKRAEREIRRSDARFRGLFYAGVVGIMIIEGDRVVEVNDYTLKMLGYTLEELLRGEPPWQELVAQEQREHCSQMMRAIAQTGICAPYEKEFVRKDGARIPVLFAGVALPPGAESQVLCLVVNLTERRNLENQMRQAQKLESIGLLAGGVAHDFNNLLTVILGYTEVLRGEAGEAQRIREPIEQISGAAARASTLVRQLLTFSRRNASQPRTIALDLLVDETRTMLRRLLGTNIEIVFTPDSAPQFIHADPVLVEQVIVNLVLNARDAMPEGGRIYLETGPITVTSGFASPSLAVAPGEYVSLAVTDTGTGMTPDVQAQLFEPFFTTKDVGKGTGLGLSTVYGIVKQSGGAITVHSTPGIGTSMRVLFPAVPAAGDVPLVPPKNEDSPGGSETVLLVEDEPGVRHYAREVLESHGYKALDASRGEDAIQMAERYQGPIHLLLTDLVLPGMKGSEVIARIRALRPDARVLRISGYPERFGSHLGDGIPHLQKPFTSEKLLRRIREILDKAPTRVP